MVEIKRKVTLRTKTSQPEEKPATEVTPEVQLSASQQEPTPTPPPPTEPTTNAEGSKGGGKWKEWLAAFVLATLLWGGYHLYSNSQGNDAQHTTTVAKTDSTDAQKDSTQTAQADSTTKVKPEADGNNVATETANETAAEGSSVSKATTPSSNTSANNTTANTTTDQQAASTDNLGTSSTTEPKAAEPANSVQETAKDVIRGTYGNGVTRRHRLGSRYEEVQKRVNEMYRQGLIR